MPAPRVPGQCEGGREAHPLGQDEQGHFSCETWLNAKSTFLSWSLILSKIGQFFLILLRMKPRIIFGENQRKGISLKLICKQQECRAFEVVDFDLHPTSEFRKK